MTLERLRWWTAEAESALGETFDGDRDEIAAGVNAGEMELWRWSGGRTYMVTRAQSGVLTVCCLQGAGLAEIAPAIVRIARRNGLRAIEFFTQRRGLARLLSSAGVEFREVATVYRCNLE